MKGVPMRKPKIVVIGAGSYFFGRSVILKMMKSAVLRDGVLALVDIDPGVLQTMLKLAQRVRAATGAPVKLIGSTQRREVLEGADFVVLTFSDRNAYFRGLDCRIAEKHGVRMCSGDSIGPGGIFRALREVPKALQIARDISEMAPEAWVINFVNPTAVLGIALMRHASLKSFAICDSLHEPYLRIQILQQAGILDQKTSSIPVEVEQKLDLRIAGINHFTWMTKFTYAGKDMLPSAIERLKVLSKDERTSFSAERQNNDTGNSPQIRAKAKYNWTYALKLAEVFGVVPVCISHTKEYVPFFQGTGISGNDPEPIRIFDAEQRAHEMNRQWRETEEYAEGTLSVQDFLARGKGDHAGDIIESMWGEFGKSFYINTANHGAVTNMADDAFLELRCDLDMQGPRPQPVGPFPRGILGLEQQVLDTHELTVEAAVSCSRDILLRAMLTDPLINNIEDAKCISDELFLAERDALPEKWY